MPIVNALVRHKYLQTCSFFMSWITAYVLYVVKTYFLLYVLKEFVCTAKPVLCGHLKINKTKVIKDKW